VRRLAEAAREGRATRAELSGSTITITSWDRSAHRHHAGDQPAGGGDHRRQRQVVRPVWQGAEFLPRTMMNLSSSFDHRVIDGYNAAQFVQRIKGLLEAPATIS